MLLGISADSVSMQKRFAEKYHLEISLLADTEHQVAEAYGVWKEKSLYGRTYMGIERATFLIGPDGIIRRVWPKVKVEGHAEEVLAAVGTASGQ